MDKTTQRSKFLNSNAKTKAPSGKGIHEAEDVETPIKTKVNKVMKKPITLSNNRKNNTRSKNTASDTFKGGNNAQRKLRAVKLSNKEVNLKGQRTNNAREALKPNKKKYKSGVLDRSAGYPSTKVACIGESMTLARFRRAKNLIKM